jgi:hypothetical protein
MKVRWNGSLTHPGRTYPAAILMALGTLIAVLGTRRQADGILRPMGDPAKAVTWMRGFRQTIAGLAVLGIGAAWLWQAPWLLALSLIIGAGEIFESSLDVWALTKGKDLQLGPRVNRR